MDLSAIIAADAARQSGTGVLEKDMPVEIDAGLLLVTDLNPIDDEAYNSNRESYLTETARDGVQLLFGTLFSLPTTTSTDAGPLAQLPKPKTLLPRAKPLPKPKAPTKWERFATAKGINKTIKDKKIWDDERQIWVDRWGRNGKNKEKEEQWIEVLPDQAADDYSPAAAARAERKQRVAKNEAQQKANVARSQRAERKSDLEKTLLTSKNSTASMGKFDKKLAGEPKVRGIKRKFAPNEMSIDTEKKNSLAILSRLDGSVGTEKRSRRDSTGENVLNVRKALRFASGGRGAAALGRDLQKKSGGNKSDRRKGK